MEKYTKRYRMVYEIEEKSNHKSIAFDIKGLYSSIKETLLIKAINFAEKYVNITEQTKTK